VSAKINRLEWLLNETNKAVFRGDLVEDEFTPSLKSYSSKLDRIHVVWYSGGNYQYNESAFSASNPELFNDKNSISDFFKQELQFFETDDVRAGDWLICWHANRDGYPRKSGHLKWMRVHYVISHGVHDEDNLYTKFVGEARKLEIGCPPFLLNEETKNLIRDALMTEDFKVLRSNENHWKTNLKASAALIDHIKQK
jgi:hypothetical protein